MGKAANILARISDAVGLSYFQESFISLLKMHSLYNLGANLSGIFLSVFLFQAADKAGISSFLLVGLFYLFSFIFEAFCNFIAVSISGKVSTIWITRIALAFTTLGYIIMLVFPDEVSKYYIGIAFLLSIGNAFYWLPYHTYCVSYTNPLNRQKGMAIISMVGNVIVLITPLISGFILSRFTDFSGYIVIFTISALSFVGSVLTMKGMHAEPTGRKGNPLIDIVKNEYKLKVVHSMSLAHIFYGIRDGAYLYYLGILIFDLISSEMLLGVGVALRSALAVLAWIIMGRFLKPQKRIVWFFISLIGSFALAVIMLLSSNVVLVFSVYVLDMAFVCVCYNTLQYTAYELTDYLSKSGTDRKLDSIALRNTSLNIGRVLGLLLFFALNALLASVDTNFGKVLPLVALNGLSILAYFFAKRVFSGVEKR